MLFQFIAPNLHNDMFFMVRLVNSLSLVNVAIYTWSKNLNPKNPTKLSKLKYKHILCACKCDYLTISSKRNHWEQ